MISWGAVASQGFLLRPMTSTEEGRWRRHRHRAAVIGVPVRVPLALVRVLSTAPTPVPAAAAPEGDHGVYVGFGGRREWIAQPPFGLALWASHWASWRVGSPFRAYRGLELQDCAGVQKADGALKSKKTTPPPPPPRLGLHPLDVRAQSRPPSLGCASLFSLFTIDIPRPLFGYPRMRRTCLASATHSRLRPQPGRRQRHFHWSPSPAVQRAPTAASLLWHPSASPPSPNTRCITLRSSLPGLSGLSPASAPAGNVRVGMEVDGIFSSLPRHTRALLPRLFSFLSPPHRHATPKPARPPPGPQLPVHWHGHYPTALPWARPLRDPHRHATPKPARLPSAPAVRAVASTPYELEQYPLGSPRLGHSATLVYHSTVSRFRLHTVSRFRLHHTRTSIACSSPPQHRACTSQGPRASR
ncbi:hypothetical protein K438DRAFT_1768000 [Mycena galopus ATCC 62051]|nr:hypothetical protein K438DRAFT_1768000 [Mycena galopus ATCC 62051]